jgi:hypothetical protein
MKSTKHNTYKHFSILNKKIVLEYSPIYAKYQASSPPQSSLRAESQKYNVLELVPFSPFQLDLTLIVASTDQKRQNLCKMSFFFLLLSLIQNTYKKQKKKKKIKNKKKKTQKKKKKKKKTEGEKSVIIVESFAQMDLFLSVETHTPSPPSSPSIFSPLKPQIK